MSTLFDKQPRAFFMIFMLEIWERFGYYTVQGILTLYFIRFLGFSDETAYYTFGAFSALVYGMIAIGGYVGDNLLGTKRSIVLGLATLALGYALLAMATPHSVFYALACICVGNGLFKANPGSLLARCYEDNDERLHGAYTLYYMAVNIGSIFALIIGPNVSKHFGYSYAFFASFIGMLLGLANFWFQRKHIQAIVSPADERPLRWQLAAGLLVAMCAAVIMAAYLLQHALIAKRFVWLVILVVLAVYVVYMRRETVPVARRMLLACILMAESVAFFVLYQQMPTSLNLFAVNHVHPFLLGIHIDPQSFQVLNPIWIVTLSPLFAWSYRKLHQRGVVFATPYKFALGMFCCGVSFFSLYFSRFFYDAHGMVSPGWLVLSYALQSCGELLVSALGLAMVAELVPRRISGFVMGMWFLSTAVAGFLGATVASYTALPKDMMPGVDSLMLYTQVFSYVGLSALLLAVGLFCIAPYLTRLGRAC